MPGRVALGRAVAGAARRNLIRAAYPDRMDRAVPHGGGDDFVLHIDATGPGAWAGPLQQPGAVDPASRPHRRRRVVVMAAGLAVLALGVGGVLALRVFDLVPLPPPPRMDPAADVVDPGGMGEVRLGEPCGDSCDVTQEFGTSDDGKGCVWFPLRAQSQPPSPSIGRWAWTRDGVVVGVGIHRVTLLETPGGAFSTWVGSREGEALDPPRGQLERWDRDQDARVAVLRRTYEEVTTTLADVTGDGLLDYASVATAAGERCALDQSAFLFMPPRATGSSAIQGDTLQGVRLGMTAAEAAAVPGWDPPSRFSGPCQTAGRSFAGVATYDVEDTVISLSAQAVAGGPRVGMTVAEVVDAMTGDVREIPREDVWPFRLLEGQDPDGRRLVVFLGPNGETVEGLDSLVQGPLVAYGMWIGESCWDRTVLAAEGSS